MEDLQSVTEYKRYDKKCNLPRKIIDYGYEGIEGLTTIRYYYSHSRYRDSGKFCTLKEETMHGRNRLSHAEYEYNNGMIEKIETEVHYSPFWVVWDRSDVIEELYDYDDNGNLISVTDPNGNIVTYDYYGNGLLKGIKNAKEQDEQSFEYNSIGLLTKETFYNQEPISYEYDGLWRIKKEQTGDIYLVSYDYIDEGLYKGVITTEKKDDLSNIITEELYDGFGNVIHADNKDGNNVRVSLMNELDIFGNVIKSYVPYYATEQTKISDRTSQYFVAYEYEHLPLLRLKKEIYEDGSSVEYFYGGETINGYQIKGNEIIIKDERGYYSKKVYDSQNNLISYHTGSDDGITFTHNEEYVYDGLGRRTSRTANGITLSSEFDMAGQQTGKTRTTATGHTESYQYRFDQNSNLVNKSTPEYVVEYHYDELDRLTKEEAWNWDGQDLQSKGNHIIYVQNFYDNYDGYTGSVNVESYRNYALGRGTHMQDQHGDTWFFYDDVGRLKIKDRIAKADSITKDHSYTMTFEYDANGPITRILIGQDEIFIYNYDNYGRETYSRTNFEDGEYEEILTEFNSDGSLARSEIKYNDKSYETRDITYHPRGLINEMHTQQYNYHEAGGTLSLIDHNIQKYRFDAAQNMIGIEEITYSDFDRVNIDLDGNVWDSAPLPEEADENSIELFWIKDNQRIQLDFEAFDFDENGLMDYIEWIVPSLSALSVGGYGVTIAGTVHDIQPDSDSSDFSRTKTATMSYDNMNRQVSIEDNGIYGTVSTAETIYDNYNRIASINGEAYEYYPDSLRLKKDAFFEYRHDNQGRIIEMIGEHSREEYRYDHRNNFDKIFIYSNTGIQTFGRHHFWNGDEEIEMVTERRINNWDSAPDASNVDYYEYYFYTDPYGEVLYNE